MAPLRVFGPFRVNQAGAFNVPFGAKAKAGFPDRATLVQCSQALSGATLKMGDFERTLESAGCGDFIYLDPPYLPLSGTAFFRHYTANRFFYRGP
jgi:DNA adenine methylase